MKRDWEELTATSCTDTVEAIRKAEEETQCRASTTTLTWQEVFEEDYSMLGKE